MNKKVLVILLCLSLFFIVYNYNDFVIRNYRYFYSDEIAIGNKLIVLLQQHYNQTGSYPNNIDEFLTTIRYEDLYYKKMNNHQFEIYFGIQLGTSLVYNSKKGKWVIEF